MTVIAHEGITKRLIEILKMPILEEFSELFDEFASKIRLRPYLPAAGEGRICPICGRDHEATEFVYALLLAALDSFITESEEFRDLLIAKGYAR